MVKLFIGILVVAVLGVGAVLYWQQKPSSDQSLSISASFYPLAEVASNVAGDYAQITTITPTGTEPHDFEPTPRDLTTINQSAIFLYNGSGLDPWADDIASDLTQNDVRVVKMSDVVALLEAPSGVENEESFPTDPHFWLDPTIMQQLTDKVSAVLVEADPEYAQAYRSNAITYKNKLAQLDAEMSTGLQTCATREFITSHAAFGYLANHYNLVQVPITGVSPEAEPSSEQLARLAEEVRAKQVRYIFFETLVSPKLAQTLAQEVGAQTLLLDPLEGISPEQQAAGQSYLTVMRANLANLRTALECQ